MKNDYNEKANYIIENYINERTRKFLAVIKEDKNNNTIITEEKRCIDTEFVENKLNEIDIYLKEFPDNSIEMVIYFSQLDSFTYEQLDRICNNTSINLTLIDDKEI